MTLSNRKAQTTCFSGGIPHGTTLGKARFTTAPYGACSVWNPKSKGRQTFQHTLVSNYQDVSLICTRQPLPNNSCWQFMMSAPKFGKRTIRGGPWSVLSGITGSPSKAIYRDQMLT